MTDDTNETEVTARVATSEDLVEMDAFDTYGWPGACGSAMSMPGLHCMRPLDHEGPHRCWRTLNAGGDA